MDQLALQSTFAKIRNGYSLRRWSYMQGSENPNVDYRLAQLFGHAGQPYGENNAPMLVTRVTASETVAQLIPFRDNWERPATRWVKGQLSGGDTFTVFSGTPYLAEDPFQSSVQYKAKPGDDLFLDDGSGSVTVVKITAVLPAGNAVQIASKQGVAVPANGTYYAKHTLDAFLVRLTVSYMIPTIQASILDPGTHINPFQSLIQVTYYDNAGAAVVEQYERTPIRELSTIAADVPYAFIDVTGDRFDVATAPATPYTQIFEVFEFQLARVPDKMEVVFDNTGPTGGGTHVHVGNIAVYYGSNVPAAAQVPPNILPTISPNPAPSTRYNVYPPPDPEDFWTGSGDIVLMPVGTQCPVGFEDIAQVLSRANSHYVVDTATGRPLVFDSFLNPLTMSLVGGNTRFDGTIPATAVDPSTITQANPSGTSLRSAQNNTSTYEIVFPLGAFAEHQLLSFRIPEIHFSASGAIDFTIPGDIRSLVRSLVGGTTAANCLLFISGIFQADNLAAAGKYAKPFQDLEDAEAVEDPASNEAAFDNQLSIPLDSVQVSVGDLIVFVDEDGVPVLQIDTGGAVFTGPDFRVLQINEGENTVTVADRQSSDTPPVAGRATEVWRFVASAQGGGGVPPTFKDNFYRVYAANTAHTHQVFVSDAEVKSRKSGGHFVSSVDHVHSITAEAVIVPYVNMKVCVKL